MLCTNPNILFLFGQDFLFVHFFNYYYYYYCLKQRLSQCDKLLLEHQFSLTPIRTWQFGDSLLKFMCVTKWWYAASRFLQFYLMYIYLISYVVQYLFTDSENTQCVYNINLVFFVDTKEGFHVMDHMNYIATDRISKLPDHLQQHILSYLSINEVVQSSVLSKRWKNVWTAVPVLGFNTILFGSTDNKKNLDIQRKLQDFYIFVEKSLESHLKQRLTIREFMLTHGLDKRSLNSRLDCWINYVVKSDVKKLSLHFAAGYYDLPQSILVAKSITVLILRWCKLDTNCGDINLPFLKKLSLSYVDADDKTIQKLVAGSLVIEDMKFLKCHGLKSIKFSGLIKAKLIEVELNDDLERV